MTFPRDLQDSATYLKGTLGRAAQNIINNKSDIVPKKRNALDHQLRYLRSIGVVEVKTRASVLT